MDLPKCQPHDGCRVFGVVLAPHRRHSGEVPQLSHVILGVRLPLLIGVSLKLLNTVGNSGLTRTMSHDMIRARLLTWAGNPMRLFSIFPAHSPASSALTVNWWAPRESNTAPMDYESTALTNMS